MKVNMTLADKRHVTLRSEGYKHGAKCFHFADSAQAADWIQKTLTFFKDHGYKTIHTSGNEYWELEK